MKIVVSACLMGESCKYNGLDNCLRELVEACERTGTEVLLVCPEVFGGLPTPRKPSEIVNGEVRTCEGISVDREFRLGAQRALDMCEQAGGPEEMSRASFRTVALVRCGSHLRRNLQRYAHRGQRCFVDLLLRHGYRVIRLASSTPACWSKKNHHRCLLLLVVVLA
ncbi:MAG: DUF523 domain-containing protein [Collinsella sp.]